jgi:NADPH-dependent glutamate synthase beta subunit-like oxidoreductase
MDCGVPFCHTGRSLMGPLQGCPINNLFPNGMNLSIVMTGEAAWIVFTRQIIFLSLPVGCARPPAKGSCVLGINDAPVTIKRIEQDNHRQRFRRRLGCSQIPSREDCEASRSSWIRTGWIGLRQSA